MHQFNKQTDTTKCLAHRQKRGSVLAVVTVSALALVILAVGFYFLLMIFGGHREVTNATDAGALQVGRDAVTSPSIALQANERRFAGLGDPRLGVDRIDLLAYNRLVGMSLLVQMNAAADGTEAARNNANTLTNIVQGPGGIADRLRAQLSLGNNFAGSFTSGFTGNSTRMVGQAQGRGLPDEHQVAYVGQNGPARATNLDVQRLADANRSPIVDFRTDQRIALPAAAFTQVNGRTYLAGYRAVAAIANARPILGVPVLPAQTHLVSRVDFNTGTGFLPANTVVPPNAFRSSSTTTDRFGRPNLASAAAIAGVGTPVLLEGAALRNNPRQATTFNPEIPRGYITIYNNGQVLNEQGVLSANPNGANTLNFTGNVINPTNNVAAQELGRGIDLDSDTGFFALTQTGQLRAWKSHQINHPGFPRPRSIVDPPHYASLPPPFGINNPFWENVLRNDSHRDLCWRAFRGTVPHMGTRAGVPVDLVDPLFLEERFGSVPAYNQIFDPRHANNPLASLWRNPSARTHGPNASVCGNGTIAPGVVRDSVTAHWIPYMNRGGPVETVLDVNLSMSSQLAQQMFVNQQFDNAYRGCGGWSYGAFGTIPNVTAAEAVKLSVFSAYGQGPRPGVAPCESVNNAFASGLRRYTRDPGAGNSVPYAINEFRNAWSDTGRRGVVTQPGSLAQLFEQVQPGSSARLRRFLLSRMQQIRAEASENDVNAIINTPVDTSGAPYFVYLNGAGNFILTQQPPPAANDVAVPGAIDGRVFTFSRRYPLLDTMANARNDNDIHERLFMTVATGANGAGPPVANATEIAQFATASGFNLELGKVVLRQDANANLRLCDRN